MASGLGVSAWPTLVVGPIALAVEADPFFAPWIDELWAECRVPDADALGTREGPARHRLTVRLERCAIPRDGLPRTPAFAASDGRWVDRSAGWEATLRTGTEATTLSFGLREVMPSGPIGDPYRRQWVASALRVALAMAAPSVGGLLVHGAALEGPPGVVFLGASGAGKTTMAARLRPWRLLADDAALVYPLGERSWSVVGTPAAGRERLARDLQPARLDALVHLVPGALLALAPLADAEAFAALLPRILWFAPPGDRVLAAAQALIDAVPSRRLASTLADDVRPLLVSSTPRIVEAPEASC